MTEPVPAPSGFSLSPDASLRVLDDGEVLLGGSPLRFLRVTSKGVGEARRLLQGEDIGTSLPSRRLARRLLDAGMAHPCPPSMGGPGVEDVSVVVPVRDRSEELSRCLRSLGPAGEVVVVDDGSFDPRPVVEAATAAGGRVIRRSLSGGPGVARNTGARSAHRPILAFVDSDVEVPAGWLDPLLAHFADPAVVAVAPRVASREGDGTVLHRYEEDRSPIDLGPDAASVRPRTRVAYVPAAVLLVRREALLGVGGFDDDLRVGEDVDLVWRLVEGGGTVRYEPRVVAMHDPRSGLVPMVRQRIAYGSSAASLARRHPGAVAPLGVSVWSVVLWTLALLGRPKAAGAVAAVSALLLAARLRGLRTPVRQAVRLTALGHWGAGRLMADAVVRSWWPLALVAALVSRRARRVLVVALVVPPLVEWVQRRPRVGPVVHVLLRRLDDVSYGAGLWAGCLRERSAAALAPDLRSWPGRRPGL